MDWATFVIEAIGIAILLTWIVIPIREFQTIFREIRARGGMSRGSSTSSGGTPADESHTGDRPA